MAECLMNRQYNIKNGCENSSTQLVICKHTRDTILHFFFFFWGGGVQFLK